MNSRQKEHSIFFTILTVLFLLFMGKMFFLEESFITGDNLVQGLPWLKVYADTIKNLHFPFWVRGIQCGFPLMSEGQVGGFYPFNLMFFFFLPFKAAYNYSILFHLFTAAVCTYFLSRKLGADLLGGVLSAAVLLFGSAFSNIGFHLAMVRSLSLFPLGILLIELYFDKQKNKNLFLLALVMTFQILSGSLQTAFYSFVLYFVYLIAGIYSRKLNAKKGILGFFLFALIPVISFLPQFFLTLKVIKYSGRISSLDFALWGSLNPVSILTVYFPSIYRFKGQITTEDLFLGSLTVLFIISAVRSLKSNKTIIPSLFTGVVALFFSLGWFNPVYILFLKIFRFYTFRAPSRFIFFFVFSCSLLGGIGFTEFFRQDFDVIKKYIKTYLKSILLVFLLVITGTLVLVLAKDMIIDAGRFLVERFVYRADYHRYDMTYYYGKLDALYRVLIESVFLSKKEILLSLFFMLASVLFCCFILTKKISLRGKGKRVIAMYSAFAIIILNLWVYRFYPGTYRENVRSFNVLMPGVYSDLYEIVKEKGSNNRILPFDIKSGKLPVWSIPNLNMYYNIDSIAAYSPLSSSIYYNKLKDFQVVDDSIGLKKPVNELTPSDIDLLRMLNVKYIVSARRFFTKDLLLLSVKSDVFLYEVKNTLKKGFFSRDLKGSEIYDQNVKTLRIEDTFAEFEIITREDGYLVFSQQYFPGWKVFVNGQERDLSVFNDIFMAVRIREGDNKVSFKYTVM